MRNLLYLLLILLLLAGSATLWSWHLATRLPDWYLERAPTAGPLGREAAVGLLERLGRELLGETSSGVDWLSDRLERMRLGLGRGATIEIGERELEALVVGRLSREPDGRALLRAARAVRVSIGPDAVELGAVIDPARLPEESTGNQAAEAIRSLTHRVPGLANRELYFALRGVPAARNGDLLLDDSTRVRLGRLTLPAAATAAALDVERSALLHGVEIDLGHLRLESIELAPGKLRARLLPAA